MKLSFLFFGGEYNALSSWRDCPQVSSGGSNASGSRSSGAPISRVVTPKFPAGGGGELLSIASHPRSSNTSRIDANPPDSPQGSRAAISPASSSVRLFAPLTPPTGPPPLPRGVRIPHRGTQRRWVRRRLGLSPPPASVRRARVCGICSLRDPPRPALYHGAWGSKVCRVGT